ncbi:hypothetical protein [Enterococcus sp. DIV1420a]|uniref:hypothetical protein n=1 Tax=Enterococcus sp. DIV1420a TaxID=2774672 RepID=UPI003F21E8DE
MLKEQTISGVILPYIKELTKARKNLIKQEEQLKQIEANYKEVLLSLKKKITAADLLKKQKLAASLEKQNQVVSYYQLALDELIASIDTNETRGELRQVAQDLFSKDQNLIQMNKELSLALNNFLKVYDECSQYIRQRQGENITEVTPYIEALGNPPYSYHILNEVTDYMPLPDLLANLSDSKFYARFAPQEGLIDPLKRIYLTYKSDESECV